MLLLLLGFVAASFYILGGAFEESDVERRNKLERRRQKTAASRAREEQEATAEIGSVSDKFKQADWSSLYTRYGGDPGIDKAVDRFYDLLLEDAELMTNLKAGTSTLLLYHHTIILKPVCSLLCSSPFLLRWSSLVICLSITNLLVPVYPAYPVYPVCFTTPHNMKCCSCAEKNTWEKILLLHTSTQLCFKVHTPQGGTGGGLRS